MGKYKIKERPQDEPDNRYRKIKLDYLLFIANELAEANRLKRYELSKNNSNNELVDGMHKWVPDEELEDQA